MEIIPLAYVKHIMIDLVHNSDKFYKSTHRLYTRRDGRTPGDRAELAGYSGQLVGENIAAGQDTPRKVLDGWLTSPGHCANLMNPQFSELGAAYAVDPKSDAGIYWTSLFGAP